MEDTAYGFRKSLARDSQDHFLKTPKVTMVASWSPTSTFKRLSLPFALCPLLGDPDKKANLSSEPLVSTTEQTEMGKHIGKR